MDNVGESNGYIGQVGHQVQENLHKQDFAELGLYRPNIETCYYNRVFTKFRRYLRRN